MRLLASPLLSLVVLENNETSVDSLADVSRRLAAVTTEFVVIVASAGDFTPRAAERLSRWLTSRDDVDVFYCDEAVIGHDESVTVFAKPDFSPERLRCQFYFGSVVAYRTSLLEHIGGLRADLAGAALYDLALRASRAARVVVHADEVLFHARTAPLLGEIGADDVEHTRTALEEHLAATHGGVVRSVQLAGVHHTARLLVGSPRVSLIIPTRGSWSVRDGERHSFLLTAVRSILALSTYENLEFVIVHDSVADVGILDTLRNEVGSRLNLVEWSEPFNFSSKINLGVVHSRGEFLLILNDDVELITPDWIEAMLPLAQLPGAGMVGCMLYYGDETIQHAGHSYWKGDASHIGLFRPRNSVGALKGYLVEREVLGVTAACALMPRQVFYDVGGMTALLPGNFNDVDLCMKVTTAGYSIYWTPWAELYHYESKTRVADVRTYEVDLIRARWNSRMHDPRYWPYPV